MHNGKTIAVAALALVAGLVANPIWSRSAGPAPADAVAGAAPGAPLLPPPDATDDGRYHVVSGRVYKESDVVFLVDTRTGRVWSSDSQIRLTEITPKELK